MQKILILFLSVFVLNSCTSSDETSSSFESNILVNNVRFIPTSARVLQANSNIPGESALNFNLSKGTVGYSNYEAISFNIMYPTNSSTAPSGVYDFGIGVIGEVLFANGTYVKGNSFYSLAGFTVQVTHRGNNDFRLDFQNIEAINPVTGGSVIISGFFDGNMQ